MKPQAKNTDRT